MQSWEVQSRVDSGMITFLVNWFNSWSYRSAVLMCLGCKIFCSWYWAISLDKSKTSLTKYSMTADKYTDETFWTLRRVLRRSFWWNWQTENVNPARWDWVLLCLRIGLFWGEGGSEVITSASDLEELGEPGHVLPWRKSRINKSILKGFSIYLTFFSLFKLCLLTDSVFR